MLVIVDSTTHYTIAVPTRQTDARTVVRALINNVCHTHRTPTTIISDNGTHFTAHIVKAVADAIGAQQSLVSPYHQSANGKAERAIGRIKQAIGKMITEESKREKEWQEVLPAAVAVINKTVQSHTHHSPHFLLFGMDPYTQPIDAQFSTQDSRIDKMLNGLAIAHGIVAQQAHEARAKVERELGKWASSVVPGSLVMLKKPNPLALEAKWSGPYTVTQTNNNGTTIIVSNNEQQQQSVNIRHVKPYYTRNSKE